jgi:hypothetical protein
LVAEWKEPRDDPTEVRPYFGQEMIQAQAQVLDFAVPAPGQELDPMFDEDILALGYQDDQHLTFHTLHCQKLRDDLQKEVDCAPNLTDHERDTLRTQIDILAQIRPHEFGDTRR